MKSGRNVFAMIRDKQIPESATDPGWYHGASVMEVFGIESKQSNSYIKKSMSPGNYKFLEHSGVGRKPYFVNLIGILEEIMRPNAVDVHKDLVTKVVKTLASQGVDSLAEYF